MKINLKISGVGSVEGQFTAAEPFSKVITSMVNELNEKGFKLNLEVDYEQEDGMDECGTIYINGNEVIDQTKLPLNFE